MLKKMTKMANFIVEYLALLRQLASFYKGWVGDRSIIQNLEAPCSYNSGISNSPTLNGKWTGLIIISLIIVIIS